MAVEKHADAGAIIAALWRNEKPQQLEQKHGIPAPSLRRYKRIYIDPEKAKALQNDPELAGLDPLEELRTLYFQFRAHVERAEDDPDDWVRIKSMHDTARKDMMDLATLMGKITERRRVTIGLDPALQDALVDALRPYPDASVAFADTLVSFAEIKELEEAAQ